VGIVAKGLRALRLLGASIRTAVPRQQLPGLGSTKSRIISLFFSVKPIINIIIDRQGMIAPCAVAINSRAQRERPVVSKARIGKRIKLRSFIISWAFLFYN
jgi:hypothetical protein